MFPGGLQAPEGKRGCMQNTFILETLCLVREAILQYTVIQKYKSVYQYTDEDIKWTRPEK